MWVKLDDHFCDHPKVVAAGPLAGWLFVAALCYANRFLTDGFVPEGQVERLLPAMNGHGKASTLVERLIAIGLWRPAEVKGVKGYRIHDFLKYQPSRRKVLKGRKETADRVAKWRAEQAAK